MRKGNFLKTSLKGVLFSNILNCCAMEECKKYDSSSNLKNISTLNNKSSNNLDKLDFIKIINENYKTKNDPKIQPISCNKIDNDKFFCDKYQIYKLFNDKDGHNV